MSTPSMNTVPGGGSRSRGQQLQQGRLAAAGRPDNRRGLPGLNGDD